MNINIKIISLLIVFFQVSTSVVAQDTLLSRPDAVSLVLENNHGILMAKNQVLAAQNSKSILNSGYLPSLTGTAAANYAREDATIEFPGRVITDTEGAIIVDPLTGNSQNFPDVELDKAEAQRYSAAITANYTLFDGLGRLYNYKILKERYQLTALQARETIENTLLQMFSIYYEVARLTENSFVQKQTLEISKKRVERANYAFEYGQNTKLDLLNAAVDIVNDSIGYLNTQQQLNNAKRDLNVILNKGLDKSFSVDTTTTFTPTVLLEGFVKDALSNNVAILQANRNSAINEYDIKVSAAGYLPTVDLNGSYGWNLNQNAASAFFPGTNNKSINFNLGASLRWNLFDGGSTSVRIKNAKIAFENQELQKEQIVLEVRRDIQNALAIFNNRYEIYKIQEQNVATNINNFERSKEQFQLGRISSIVYRQAQINLLNARTNKNSAKYDAKFSELQVLQLTGQLLNSKY